MKPLACSLACLAWACNGQILDCKSEERKGSSLSPDLADYRQESALACLLFAHGVQDRRIRIPVARRTAPTLRLPRTENIITPSGNFISPDAPLLQDVIVIRKPTLLNALSARRSNTKMGKLYSIPPADEKVWIEKNVPVTAERVLYLGGEVDDELIYRIIASMIYLDALDHSDIYLYINSPGGSVIAGLALYDTMQHIKSDVITVNMGMAASTASLVLGGGVRGKRVGLSSSGVMIHQPASGGLVGGEGVLDKRVDADQVQRIKDVIVSMYADMTNQPRDKIIQDVSFDNYMTAQQALEYGLIDDIIENDPSWDLDP